MSFDPNNPPWAATAPTTAPGFTPVGDPTAPTILDETATAPPASPPPAAADQPNASGDAPAPAKVPALTAGQIVAHHYFDPYSGAGGEERVVAGIVLEVTDSGARIVFLPDPSDPVPFNELELLS